LENYFLIYLFLLPTLATASWFIPFFKNTAHYLIPNILNNNKHTKKEYWQTGVSYLLWVMWVVSLNVCIAYWFQDYNKPSEINKSGMALQAFHFISLALAIIFTIISMYYFYEALFMKGSKALSKIESITYFDIKLIHTYATKLKLYFMINLCSIAAIILPIHPIELTNIIAIIIFLLSLGRMRAYELKLSGCFGESPDTLLLSSSKLSKDVYIHSFQLLRKYKMHYKTPDN